MKKVIRYEAFTGVTFATEEQCMAAESAATLMQAAESYGSRAELGDCIVDFIELNVDAVLEHIRNYQKLCSKGG